MQLTCNVNDIGTVKTNSTAHLADTRSLRTRQKFNVPNGALHQRSAVRSSHLRHGRLRQGCLRRGHLGCDRLGYDRLGQGSLRPGYLGCDCLSHDRLRCDRPGYRRYDRSVSPRQAGQYENQPPHRLQLNLWNWNNSLWLLFLWKYSISVE